MAGSPDDDRKQKQREESIEEHEDLDAETVVKDVRELFAPDNREVPPPQPDAPPPDGGE